MRPLTCADDVLEMSAATNVDIDTTSLKGSRWYELNRQQFRTLHHSQCLFNRELAIVPGLHFEFDDFGVLHGEFICNGYQQGYDQMVHGGVLASIVDASMAQCLMGHGVAGYTASLSVKYRKPVAIRIVTKLETSIVAVNYSVLYSMICRITQNDVCVVKADGKFFKVR